MSVYRNARAVARRTIDGGKLCGARVAGHVLYAIAAEQAPLRGVWSTTDAYCARTGDPFIPLTEATQLACDLPGGRDLGSPPDASRESLAICPPTFVATIRGARTIYDHGAVVSPDNRLLADVSPDLGGGPNRRALNGLWLPRVRKVQESCAILSAHAHQRYFHWMFDVLPRIALLREAAVEPERYIVTRSRPFQREALRILGIADRVVEPSMDSQIRPRELLFRRCPAFRAE